MPDHNRIHEKMKSLIVCVSTLLGVSIATYIRVAPVSLWSASHIVQSLPAYHPHVEIQPVHEEIQNIATVYQTQLQNAIVYQPQQPFALIPGQILDYQQSVYATCKNSINKEIEHDFRVAMFNTLTSVFKKIVQLSDAHFVYAPHAIWKALAALAEGSEGATREQLFMFLGLPEDRCSRQLYYHIVSSSQSNSNDVVVDEKQIFIADSSVILNQNWIDIINTQKLIEIAQVPYKINPLEVSGWKQTFNAQLPNINLHGNSLILQSLDYQGLWTSAFSEANIAEEPFYNPKGEQIATLQYMKMRKIARVAYIPSVNMKILDLPLGKDSRYSMLFALVLNNRASRSSLKELHSDVLFEAFNNFKQSNVPIEVAIPRITMTSEIDVRHVMEEIGIKGLWEDTHATRNISEPAALPSSYIQRVTVTLTNSGVRPAIPEYKNHVGPVSTTPEARIENGTGLDPAVGTDFIVNRPFLFGLIDTKSYVCLFGSSFSRPSY